MDIDIQQLLLMTWYETRMNRVDVDIHWSLLRRLHEKYMN